MTLGPVFVNQGMCLCREPTRAAWALNAIPPVEPGPIVTINDEGRISFNYKVLSEPEQAEQLDLSAELERFRLIFEDLHGSPAPEFTSMTLHVSAQAPMRLVKRVIRGCARAGVYRYDLLVETPRYWSDE